jgi:hypothetical protein
MHASTASIWSSGQRRVAPSVAQGRTPWPLPTAQSTALLEAPCLQEAWWEAIDRRIGLSKKPIALTTRRGSLAGSRPVRLLAQPGMRRTLETGSAPMRRVLTTATLSSPASRAAHCVERENQLENGELVSQCCSRGHRCSRLCSPPAPEMQETGNAPTSPARTTRVWSSPGMTLAPSAARGSPTNEEASRTLWTGNAPTRTIDNRTA